MSLQRFIKEWTVQSWWSSNEGGGCGFCGFIDFFLNFVGVKTVMVGDEQRLIDKEHDDMLVLIYGP